MYKIETKPYGYKLTFADMISPDEMREWAKEVNTVLSGQIMKFGVFVDMRTLKPLSPEAKDVMAGGQKLFKEKGMQRSVVILENPIITIQFKEIGKKSGIYEWERYVDASTNADWEEKGIAWLKDGVDPDKK
jgi:hypothetical protein